MGGLDSCKIRRRLADRTATCEGSLACPRATKVVHGSRARDVEQPALFGRGLGTARMSYRDETILEACHKDDTPFEALCAVEGHDVDGVPDLPGRIGAQARVEPGDEPGCTRTRVVPEVLHR